jgi:hypothetical protein
MPIHLAASAEEAMTMPTAEGPILMLHKGLKISLATLAIVGIGIPMSMATWVALALIGY